MTEPNSRPDVRALFVYELVESDPLPTLDLTRSLGQVCCKSCASSGARVSDIVNDGSPKKCPWTVRLSWFVAYWVCPALVIAAIRAPHAIGQSLTGIAVVMNFPYFVYHFRALRFDIVRLVVRTPDFWYFTLVSLFWCLSFAVYLNGIRSVLVVIPFLMGLIVALVDANTVLTYHVTATAVSGVVMNLAMIVMVNRQLVDDACHFAVFRQYAHVLNVEDVIVSGILTHTVHLIRNAYRRRYELMEQRRIHCRMLRCIVYRYRAQLQLVESEALASIAPQHRPSNVPTNKAMTGICRVDTPASKSMVRVPVSTSFDAANTMYPVDLTGRPWSRKTRLALVIAAWSSIALTAAMFLEQRHTTTTWHRATGVVALTLTGGCCVTFWCICQLQLIRHIVQSFDFLYLSVQLTLAHLCVCDFIAWDTRCMAVLCSWLWTHVVLTSDALTPIVRAKTGISARHLAPILALFITVKMILVYQLAVVGDWNLTDRVIYTLRIGSRTIEIRVLRVYVARVISILWWSLRVLYRLFTVRDGELIELRVKVAYATDFVSPKPAAGRTGLNHVAPSSIGAASNCK